MSKVDVSREQFRQAFLNAWGKVYSDENRKPDLEVIYRESWSGWTEIMLGKAPHLLDDKCLIARAFDELSIIVGKAIQFDPERHDVDAFGRVKENQGGDYEEGVNVVMVEVENNTKRSYEEFWKLVHSRCTLKVLFTYLVPGREDEFHGALNEMQKICERATTVLGPDDKEDYLLVVGWRKDGKPEIHWRFLGLNADGRFTEAIE